MKTINSNKDVITRAFQIGKKVLMWYAYSKMINLLLLTDCLSVLVKTFCSLALEY